MPFVLINCVAIRDWPSFHDEFARAMGFPSFYGRNLDAWIDCMSSLDAPRDGMTSVHCVPPDVVTLVLDRADLLPREILTAIHDCAACVNWRRFEQGKRPVLAVAGDSTGTDPASQSLVAEFANQPRSVAIAVGGNLGDVAIAIHAALERLRRSVLLSDVRLSSLYRTAPVRVSADAPDPGGAYINAAIAAESAASPHALLALLHDVERDLGRSREDGANPHGAPRPIDLDLLVVGDVTLNQPELSLPHPRMHQRAFVLVPLAEIAPGLRVPGTGKTVAQLLAALGPIDSNAVQKLGAPLY
ncbi:MAG: 2-amino-4-hydroxy-6-hydroxymethyldihydropteridine diphosphokinase [Phycisphaerales bacterium]